MVTCRSSNRLMGSTLSLSFSFPATGFSGFQLFSTIVRSVARRGKGIASAREGTSGAGSVGKSEGKCI